MAKKLGKGLNEIFGENIDSFLDDISNNGTSNNINIKEIRPNPYQPRKNFDEDSLKELASSIKENGVFQPILVRKSLSGYELVAGERRLRASKIAGKQDIPAIIVEFDDKQMMEISLLENIQREDLSPIEEAKAYEQLIKKLNYTQDELAKRVSKSRVNITNLLRLLKLPEEIQLLVNDKKLSYGQARTLLSLDDKEKMYELANRCIKEGISVRELERLVKQDKSIKKTKKEKKEDPYLLDLKNRLQRIYSTKVEIKNKSIIIKYNNNEDLNRILDIMKAIEGENDD